MQVKVHFWSKRTPLSKFLATGLPNGTLYLESNLLLSDVQYGFRSGRSCELQLLRVVNHWTDCFDAGKDIDILYLDLQNAFDKIPHKLLICKLEAYGVNGDVLNWIQNFLSNRR